jgi:hypothetical protein
MRFVYNFFKGFSILDTIDLDKDIYHFISYNIHTKKGYLHINSTIMTNLYQWFLIVGDFNYNLGNYKE